MRGDEHNHIPVQPRLGSHEHPANDVEAGVAQRRGVIWLGLFSLSLVAARYVQMGVDGRTLLVRAASGEILA